MEEDQQQQEQLLQEKLHIDFIERLLEDDDEELIEAEEEKPTQIQQTQEKTEAEIQHEEHLRLQHLEFAPVEQPFDWAFAAKLQARLEQRLNARKPFEKVVFEELDDMVDNHLAEINKNCMNYDFEFVRLFPKVQPDSNAPPKNSFL